MMEINNRSIREKGFVGVCYPSKGLALNEEKLFMPASNTKLYTSWLACRAFGEEHSFHSRYSISGGRLHIDAQCNPVLSERLMNDLIEEIEGRKIDEIVLCTEGFSAPPYPPSWNIGDRYFAYGAPVSPVCFNENKVVVTVAGEAKMSPENGYYRLSYSAALESPMLDGRTVHLPVGFRGEFEFPVLNPPAFLGHWLASGLGLRKRTARTGRFRGRAVSFGAITMPDVLNAMNKHSSNIIAELLMLNASMRLGQHEIYSGKISAFDRMLPEAGVTDAVLYDGSGLSRYNLASPSGTVRLLESCRRYGSIIDSLPVGGIDGTLRTRNLPSSVHAKTGSLSGVQTLSGYSGKEAFSVMINHFPGDAAEMKDEIDRIVRGE